jgi:large subunit ribosomal protein L10
LPTERKIQQVADLVDRIQRAQLAVATSYSGESVGSQSLFRQAMSDAAIDVKVVKNTLLRRAAADAGLPMFSELAEGPTAVVFAYDEPVPAIKTLVSYLSSLEETNFVIRNGIYEGQLVDKSYIETLATLPSKEELLARLAGNLVGKISEFASLLVATQRDFAGLIAARAEQLAAEAPTEEVPTEEAPTEEAPTEEAPAAEAPTEEAPVAEAPEGEATLEAEADENK